MLQVLQDMRQVAETAAMLLGLVAHCGAVIEQNCIEVHILAENKLPLVILLAPQTSLEDLLRWLCLRCSLGRCYIRLREVAENDLAAIWRKLADRCRLQLNSHGGAGQLLELGIELVGVLAFVQVVIVQQNVLVYACQLVFLKMKKSIKKSC